jgi:hypothetical protein
LLDRIYRINLISCLSLFPDGREKTQSGFAEIGISHRKDAKDAEFVSDRITPEK